MASALLVMLLGARVGEARPCEFLPMPCMYEGTPFTLTVVDAETGQPLADVHALAEWQNYGMHGLGGPFMVQDTLSAADGVLRFPKWGPIRGYVSGLVSGFDPVVSLFKPGYEVVVEHNKLIVDDDTEKVRRFGQDGATIRLVPFRATPRSWIHQLRTVARPQVTRMSDDSLLQFHGPYLNRFQRVWTEVQLLPEPERSDALREFRILESNMRVLGGQR